MPEKLATMEKAFEINAESSIYEMITGIGAGQEIVHYFFLAVGARRYYYKDHIGLRYALERCPLWRKNQDAM